MEQNNSSTNNSILLEKNRKLLKTIAKYLHNDNNHFYDPHTATVLPAFASLLHSVYNALQPLCDHARIPDDTVLEKVIYFFAENNDKRVITNLRQDILHGQLKQAISVAAFSKRIKENVIQLKVNLLSQKQQIINQTYTSTVALKELASFSFLQTIQKFNSTRKQSEEGDAHFVDVAGGHVVEDIVDFTTRAINLCNVQFSPYTVDVVNNVFLKIKKEIVSNEVESILRILDTLIQQNILSYIVQHLKSNPLFYIPIPLHADDTVERYINMLENRIKDVLSKDETESTEEEIRILQLKLFNHSRYATLAIYNPDTAKILLKYGMYCMRYTEIIICIATFIETVYVREVLNRIQKPLLFIAQWTSIEKQRELSYPMGDLQDIAREIRKIDNAILNLEIQNVTINDILHTIGSVAPATIKIFHLSLKKYDNQYRQLIDIFQKICELLIAKITEILNDRTTTKPTYITNWVVIRQQKSNILFNMEHAKEMLVDINTLVTKKLAKINE